MPQQHHFPGETWRQAGERRREYEERCVRAGAIAHRGRTTRERHGPNGVTVTTEHSFTGLSGATTEEAEEIGIVEYLIYKTVLYPRDF